MSGKRVYKIVKSASKAPAVNRSLDRPQNIFSPPKGRVEKKRLWPIIFTAVVWSTCLPLAFYAWKNKKSEEDIKPVESEESENTKSYFRAKFETYEEKGLHHFKENVPSVKGLVITVNKEKQRVEILNVKESTWSLRVIPFKNIQRDEDGHFIFDKEGRPVTKPFSVKNMFSNFNEWLKKRDP